MARRIVIFANNDFTRGKAGSHVRMAELADFIQRNFGDGIVYGFNEHADSAWDDSAAERFARQYPQLTLVRDSRSRWLELFIKIKTIALNLFPGSAGAILRWRLPGSTPNWEAIRRQPDDCLLIVHWVDGAAWLNGLPDCPWWIESHDIKFLKHAKRTGAAIHTMTVSRRLMAESAVLAAATGIVSISPVDHAIIGALAPDAPKFYIPTYTESNIPQGPEAGAAFAHDLLFVGSGNAFNVAGLSAFIAANADWLNGKNFAVAGSVSQDPQVRAALALVPGAKALGFVEDLAPLYAASKVVVSPVDGTGLKIKVVEALAHGKPVFASRHSRDALPGNHGDCVFDLDPVLIDAMLADDARLAAAMSAARSYSQTIVQAGERDAFLTALRASG